MNSKTLTALLAAAALAGCNKQDQTIVADPTGGATEPVNTVGVELPASIVASHKYRCSGDNSVISIDWLAKGTENSARVTPEGGAAVTLAQAEADGPYTAEGGASLTGDPQAQSVTYAGKSCKR